MIANRIIAQVIVPRFRQGDFAGGIAEGVNRIIAVGKVNRCRSRRRQSHRSNDGIGSALPLLLMLVFVGGGILVACSVPLAEPCRVGGIAAVLAWLLTVSSG